MSVISVSKEELFNVMQYTNLVRVRFENDDVWTVLPILYAGEDQVDILVDASKITLPGDVCGKAVIKFQRKGYEYIINGHIDNKSEDAPATVTIKYIDAKKYYNLRKHIRFDVNINSRIKEKDAGQKCESSWKEATVRNISKGGAMFVSNVKLDFNSMIDMKLYFDSSKEFVTSAKILRVSELGNGEFGYGVQFAGMSKENWDILNTELLKFEEKYFKSLSIFREYKRTSDMRFDTKIVIFSSDIDESYDIRESLIKLGAENFDVINNFKFYFDYLTEEKPKLVIIDTNTLNDEVVDTVRNIKTDFPDMHVQIILPIELMEEDILGTLATEDEILFKPLIYNEFEDRIIKYL
ncbi:MAG TPA: histidine kinase [Hungateiclostridium thermocellum]|uniref:Type IV pilus assembly PilZ n=1 Tax=Acetivibrio thermocellus (strain ATCC 27405 / DSM 1237 / JCM 9322 / NBRC 103400 / NCIMB 10682 / NRRL B-4536 / VPI 7372) TaxID=203119 RepID=A3DJG2_ACET2|nr:PilZ domain-containing protein [Acetivibrio thermocellus]ABN54091.1 type IV pilus assembly PilZ [Acetivibrio thermocellus ATCC 27405]UWV47356.1 PilZ domain-containing protein [Acetivibrio thermocellus]HBW27157.1 histidine kinase [Acetivibrio thermocellus]